MTTKSSILELLEQHGALKDGELARLLGVAHQQVNQAARALAGRGAIRRAAGADGVIRNSLAVAGAGLLPPLPPLAAQDTEPISRESKGWPVLSPVVPGTLVARDELLRLGFIEHPLERFADADVPEGAMIGWNTIGAIPTSPGLYCFVGREKSSDDLHVFYVGMTTHLWMVTKGQLPGGVARGGQRYGRPRHAGATRQRVNAEVARLSANGWVVSHWLCAVQATSDPATLEALLCTEESRLIARWNLRVDGWNRRD